LQFYISAYTTLNELLAVFLYMMTFRLDAADLHLWSRVGRMLINIL